MGSFQHSVESSLLNGMREDFGLSGFKTIGKTFLSTLQYMQWRMWFTDEVKTKLHILGYSGKIISGVKLTYELLIGEVSYACIKCEAAHLMLP